MKTRTSITRTACPKALAWCLGTACAARLLPLLLLLAPPAAMQAQYTYTTNNGTITITKYTGPGGVMAIPATINDLPVTSIGTLAFDSCSNLTTTLLWKPQMLANDASFGVWTNQFGFNIAWASGRDVVVEACTNLVNPAWFPVQTNTLNGGSFYFSDPQWTNYPAHFYRLRSP